MLLRRMILAAVWVNTVEGGETEGNGRKQVGGRW